MKLALMQVNSGIKVLFDMDLAYRGNRNTNISLQLRSQRPGKGINGFVDVGEVVTLGYVSKTITLQTLLFHMENCLSFSLL